MCPSSFRNIRVTKDMRQRLMVRTADVAFVLCLIFTIDNDSRTTLKEDKYFFSYL